MSGAGYALQSTSLIDAYLRSDNEASVWTIQQRKTTPSAMTVKRYFATGSAMSSQQVVTIQNPADMLWQTFLVTERPPLQSREGAIAKCDAVTYWANAFGYIQMEKVALVVGSTELAIVYGQACLLMDDILGQSGRRLEEMIGKRMTVAQLTEDSRRQMSLFTPISGFWTGSPAMALRCVAMSLAMIQFTLYLRRPEELAISNQVKCVGNGQLQAVPPVIVESQNFEISLVVFMFWLGARERIKLAAKTEDLVVRVTQINQGQHNFQVTGESVPVQILLTFTMPIVFMMIVAQNLQLVNGRHPDFINFSGPNGTDAIRQMQLELGADPVSDAYPGVFWRVVMPWVFFKHIPRLWQYVMVFATHPSSMEELTGSLNLIPLDSARINIALAGVAGAMITYATSAISSAVTLIKYGGASVHRLFG